MRRPAGLGDAERNFPDGPTYRCGRRPGTASFASCLIFCKDPEAYRAFFGYAEELISVHIQQSGRLGIIGRFENLDSVDSKRARIKVIQVIPPSALRSIFYVAHSFTPTLQSTVRGGSHCPWIRLQ